MEYLEQKQERESELRLEEMQLGKKELKVKVEAEKLLQIFPSWGLEIPGVRGLVLEWLLGGVH